MPHAINTAATVSFLTVMLLGMGSLLVHRVRLNRLPASLVNRRKAHVARKPAPSGAAAPATIWDHTVDALGDPETIDLNPPPCPAWPTWASIPDSRYQTAIAALANEH